TTINAGTLQLSGGGTLGATTAGTIVNSGATLQLSGVTTAEPLTLNGSGVGGSLVDSSAGALQETNFNSTVTGPITLGSDAVIGVDSTRNLTINSSPVTLNGHTLSVNSAGSTTLNTPIVDGVGGSGNLVINSSLVPNAPVSAGTVTLAAP